MIPMRMLFIAWLQIVDYCLIDIEYCYELLILLLVRCLLVLVSVTRLWLASCRFLANRVHIYAYMNECASVCECHLLYYSF